MHYMVVLFFFLGVFFTYESQAIFILTSRNAKKKKKKTKTDQSVSRIFTLSERKRPTNL